MRIPKIIFQSPRIRSLHLLLEVDHRDEEEHPTAKRKFCEQTTLTRHIFSHLHVLISMSHVTLAQGVLRTSSMCHPHVGVLILFDPLL